LPSFNGRAYKQSELLDNGRYKVLRVGNFFSNNSWYYSDLELEEEKYCDFGDLLFAWSASFGPRIWEGDRTIFHYHIWKMIPDNNSIDKIFLYYYLLNKTKSFMNSTHGSIMLHLTKSFMEDLTIVYPENLLTQKSIAKILSDLDAKIELNNRINAELEAMAKTLYDYWFVQFDFPDANGKPYKSSGGCMVWNEQLKRNIPEGWEVKKLSDWIDKTKSGDWGSGAHEGNYIKKVTCFRGADINGLNGISELNPPVRYILEKNENKVLSSHDLIIEISGGSPTQSTGRLAFITDETINRFDSPLVCSNFCKAISLKNEKLLYNFAYLWNSLYDNGAFFGYEGKTSGIKNFLFDSFVNSYYTVLPDENLVGKFYSFMETIQKKKQKSLAENQHLASLRDWLLPMLMNGQVTVGEAEEISTVIEKPIINLSDQQDERFELWLNKRGIAARGEIDTKTLRTIFNAIDEDD
jgi:type I restriction enzyme S subunit